MAIADETGTIVLGGVSYPIQALTLDQIQVVGPLFAKCFGPDGGMSILSAEALGNAAKIISAVLRKPESEIAVSLEEVGPAVGKIAEVSGLFRLGELMTKAMETAEQIGTASTPNS